MMTIVQSAEQSYDIAIIYSLSMICAAIRPVTFEVSTNPAFEVTIMAISMAAWCHFRRQHGVTFEGSMW